jgi:NADPH:quinone reductase-like Zn-dependent oxidoreductase
MFQASLDSMSKDGRLVTCGGHAGEVVDFDIIPFFRAQKSVIGSFVYTRQEVDHCYDLAARGAIKPLVHAAFPLEEVADAMRMMERREQFGKIVLTS